jgi:uncharacterized membrane protein YqjE
MRFLKNLSPYLYALMVLFVVFHNTNYQPERMLQLPYLLYVLLAVLGFWVIRSVVKEALTSE